MKNQFRIKNLTDAINLRDPASKLYVDKRCKDPRITKNYAVVDFNDKSLDNVRFNKLNSIPAVRKFLTPFMFPDIAFSKSIGGWTLLRLDPDKKLNLDEQDSIILTLL